MDLSTEWNNYHVRRMMEDSDDEDAKLEEEIEAELDKISISSLEKEENESDSKSETHSDDTDSSEDELPESVIHCINTIKNTSKAVEELILQDLEDTDVLSHSYEAVSNNHMHLRIGLLTECKENPEQLLKILSGMEKEDFMRSETHCASPGSPPEPDLQDFPIDEYVLSDDMDINFGYFEVEEKCRQSFEAWQDRQKELEDKDKETLKAQRDREEKQFQEEEEKRDCWMKQFVIEKQKIENLQKSEPTCASQCTKAQQFPCFCSHLLCRYPVNLSNSNRRRDITTPLLRKHWGVCL
ncbi:leucine-rich repeat and IQ domain-containing protein 1-like [Fukomys damarensis]|uniref:leucine-rich repeat and IQ domain-containing protein 1-like n=1 Tax=Fukomys damarensis TaxID=885580 RepID=UPI0008FEC0EA|nr:leucine-rich repeat and IQ domain-containing protein 1-like [Fukomys damarensis]